MCNAKTVWGGEIEEGGYFLLIIEGSPVRRELEPGQFFFLYQD